MQMVSHIVCMCVCVLNVLEDLAVVVSAKCLVTWLHT